MVIGISQRVVLYFFVQKMKKQGGEPLLSPNPRAKPIFISLKYNIKIKEKCSSVVREK